MRLALLGNRNLSLLICLFSLTFLLLFPTPVTAGEGDSYLLRLGGGLQCVYPEFGYSGIINLNKNSALQGMFVYTDYALVYGGKYIYRFMLRPTHNLYGYGMLGYFSFFTDSWELISSPGVISGLGLEFTTSDFITNLKYNLEVGFSTVGAPGGPPGPSIIYGGGIHFYIF
ncbi:MAG TPA: hypothetical protein DEB05_00855 [Firmicutes bacterium]|nr:hypothetical protein [Bacillota bacterium]